MHEPKLRFRFDSLALRMACVALSLVLAIPVLLVGHMGLTAFMFVHTTARCVLRLVRTLAFSIGQGFLNIAWLVKAIVGANR